MDPVVLVIILLLVIGSTTVFYATHVPTTLLAKTAIAAVGFIIIFVGVAFTGIY